MPSNKDGFSNPDSPIIHTLTHIQIVVNKSLLGVYAVCNNHHDNNHHHNNHNSSRHTGASAITSPVVTVDDDLTDFLQYTSSILNKGSPSTPPSPPQKNSKQRAQKHSLKQQNSKQQPQSSPIVQPPAPPRPLLPIDDALSFDAWPALHYHKYPNYIPPPVVKHTQRKVTLDVDTLTIQKSS